MGHGISPSGNTAAILAAELRQRTSAIDPEGPFVNGHCLVCFTGKVRIQSLIPFEKAHRSVAPVESLPVFLEECMFNEPKVLSSILY